MRAIGSVRHLFRYPVKSMAGVPLDAADLGWHGFAGDRRFAIRRTSARGGMPWLTASRLPELVLHRPVGAAEGDPSLPTHVLTPDGRELAILSEELRAAISATQGEDVELMRLDRGIFDEAPLSVIGTATIAAVEREAGRPLEPLRFRPNVVVATASDEPFGEDAWVGRTLVFGDPATGPAVAITQRDLRCAMLNIDPGTAGKDAAVMKATTRRNGNCAGVYGTVIREGRVEAGQEVWIQGSRNIVP